MGLEGERVGEVGWWSERMVEDVEAVETTDVLPCRNVT
jgi:hypothetical protein